MPSQGRIKESFQDAIEGPFYVYDSIIINVGRDMQKTIHDGIEI